MLAAEGIKVSLFIDAQSEQIKAAAKAGAPYIEIHTGHYADASSEESRLECLSQIKQGVSEAVSLGLIVNAGHGLHYHNVQDIAAIDDIYELNIGHAIIARAVFTGLEKAVADMKQIMQQARQ